MNESITAILLCVFTGLALGLFFYGGLWWTLKRLSNSRYPGLVLTGSYVIRMLVVCAGMFFIMQGNLERLLWTLAAMLVARTLLKHKWKPKNTDDVENKEKVL